MEEQALGYELVNVVIQRNGNVWTGIAMVDDLRFETRVETDLDIYSPKLNEEVGDPIERTLRNQLAVDFGEDRQFEFFLGYHETCFAS